MESTIRALGIFFLTATSTAANGSIVSFEGLTDGDIVGSYYSGLVFTNATVIQAENSLNEFEFPPNSGVSVVVDDAGAVTIDFADPLSSFSAYFTHTTTLTLSAFSDGGNLVGSLNSVFDNNLALSGDLGSAPNELITFSSSTAFSSVVIGGDINGFSFVMDDVSYTHFANVHPIPEPSSVFLVMPALVALATIRRKLNA